MIDSQKTNLSVILDWLCQNRQWTCVEFFVFSLGQLLWSHFRLGFSWPIIQTIEHEINMAEVFNLKNKYNWCKSQVDNVHTTCWTNSSSVNQQTITVNLVGVLTYPLLCYSTKEDGISAISPQPDTNFDENTDLWKNEPRDLHMRAHKAKSCPDA